MEIFISHAAADKEIAGKLAELLEIGMGVPEGKIFFSSQAGSIENGEFFVQKILSKGHLRAGRHPLCSGDKRTGWWLAPHPTESSTGV